MPMFFFLSGVSAYLALFRRTERQFRTERVHRLLVPYFVLCLQNGVYSVTFLAPRTPFCDAFYHGRNVTNNSLPWSYCETFWKPTANTTYLQHLTRMYTGPPNSGQGWFLLYLFLYSQAAAHLLVLWHPAHCWATPSRRRRSTA